MDIKAILWDLDGVLVRTEHLYFEATRDVVRLLDVELAEKQFYNLFLQQGIDPIRVEIEKKGLGNNDFIFYHRKRLMRYMELLSVEDISIKNVSNTVKKLAEKFPMGVVTGSKRELVEVIATRVDFFGCFQFVVALEDSTKTKPAPEPYSEGVKRVGIGAMSCLAVEDTVSGLKSAKAANLQCWVIPNQSASATGFSTADKILGDITDVELVLDRVM